MPVRNVQACRKVRTMSNPISSRDDKGLHAPTVKGAQRVAAYSRLDSLPADVARCDGNGSDAEGWREGCETCLRRTAPRSGMVSMIAPPPIIAFECQYLIEP